MAGPLPGLKDHGSHRKAPRFGGVEAIAHANRLVTTPERKAAIQAAADGAAKRNRATTPRPVRTDRFGTDPHSFGARPTAHVASRQRRSRR